MRSFLRHPLLRAAAVLAGLLPLTALPQASEPSPMETVMRSYFKDGEPGAVALVAVDGQVIFSQAVGVADTRSKTPLTLDNVFRIGSITKQITATAILQLVDRGDLDLKADIRTLIDFPKKDGVITVEHLLTHTSGIPNYTDLPTFKPATYRKDVSVSDVVATFKDLPLEFTPGTKFKYSNSGYILLGLIVEKVGGMSWEEHVQQNILGPLGMSHTSVSSESGRLPNEVPGNEKEGEGWKDATPLSLTWPYAAGVIRSTVEDMNLWNTAIMSGRMTSGELLAQAFTDHPLTDGSPTHYGYGWMFGRVQSTPTIEHGGGINGFSSSGIFLPQDAVYVIVLSNQEDERTGALAAELAAIALGEPYPTTVVPMDTAKLREYTGVYVTKEGVERYLTMEGGTLFSQRQGSGKHELQCTGPDRFRFVGDLTTLAFHRANGRVNGAMLRTRFADEHMDRTDRPLPVAPAEIQVEAEVVKRYVGVYELQPGFNLTFRTEGGKLFTQATGQQEFEAFASSPTEFFLKVVDARMVFYPEPDGTVKRMKLFQGGAELEGKRIK